MRRHGSPLRCACRSGRCPFHSSKRRSGSAICRRSVWPARRLRYRGGRAAWPRSPRASCCDRRGRNPRFPPSPAAPSPRAGPARSPRGERGSPPPRPNRPPSMRDRSVQRGSPLRSCGEALGRSELAGEGFLQEGLLEFGDGGKFAGVEGGEVGSFFLHLLKARDDFQFVEFRPDRRSAGRLTSFGLGCLCSPRRHSRSTFCVFFLTSKTVPRITGQYQEPLFGFES